MEAGFAVRHLRLSIVLAALALAVLAGGVAATPALAECTTRECKEHRRAHEHELLAEAKSRYEEQAKFDRERYEVQRKGIEEAYSCPGQAECKLSPQERARRGKQLDAAKGRYIQSRLKAKLRYKERIKKIKEAFHHKEEGKKEEEEPPKEEELPKEEEPPPA